MGETRRNWNGKLNSIQLFKHLWFVMSQALILITCTCNVKACGVQYSRTIMNNEATFSLVSVQLYVELYHVINTT